MFHRKYWKPVFYGGYPPSQLLAELLRLDHLNPVYHGEHGLRTLKELVRSYLTITKDLGRVMTRGQPTYCLRR